VPCGPINTIDKVLDDPQVKARDMVIEVPMDDAGGIKMVASPLKIPTAPVEVRCPPPRLGEHTDLILTDLLGYKQESIEKLRQAHVI
jgi:CoA:oxalate CoA-transferase